MKIQIEIFLNIIDDICFVFLIQTQLDSLPDTIAARLQAAAMTSPTT